MASCDGIVEARFDGGRCPKCSLTNQTPGTRCGTAVSPSVVLDARAQGRHVYITTYREGPHDRDKIKFILLFHSQADAERCCARLLGEPIPCGTGV